MSKTVFFSGYAPVHLLCYLPVYRRLQQDDDIELVLTGGFRHKESADDITYDSTGFFEPHAINPEHIMTIDDAKSSDFDVLVSSHLSDGLFPRSAQTTVQIFHGVSMKNLAVREKALRFDYLCLPGRYHAEKFRSQGLVQPGRTYAVTGFPKSDLIVNTGSFDRDSFFRSHELDPERPTILFAPTGEKGNALEKMGEQVIRAIDEAGTWNLMVKPHDHPKRPTDWDGLGGLENERIRIVRDLDIVPCLHAADVLVTDLSSVAVEYTLLDRPIIFLDIPKLIERVAKRAPALDLETYGRNIGVVAGPNELAAAVTDALANPDRGSELRRKMASHLFHDAGGAVERVAQVIRAAAGLSAEWPDDIETLRTETS